MKRVVLSFIFILCGAIVSINNVNAQVQDPIIQKVDGKKYIIHTVEAGNTLYAISRRYNVSIEDIISENPGSEGTLVIGQKLRIPMFIKKKEVQDSETPEIVDGFIIHRVKKGETVFSLSKRYNLTSVNKLIEANPGSENGIFIGQELKVPLIAVKDKIKEENLSPAVPGNYIEHLVLKGETIFGLAKRYNISMEQLQKANGGLPGGLKEGQIIIIPKEGYKVTDTLTMITDTTSVLPPSITIGERDALFQGPKDQYNVAFFVPLFLDKNDEHQLKTPVGKGKTIYKKTLRSMDFYFGLKMAVDSMVAMGMNINLYTYDTSNDTLKVKSILRKPEMANMDLIIGPVYNNPFEMVAKFATEHNIPMVCPVPKPLEILNNRPNLVQISTSHIAQTEYLSAYIAENHSLDNILIMDSKAPKDSAIKQHMISTLNLEMKKKGIPGYDTIKVLSISDNLAGLTRNTSLEKLNVIVVPSISQPSVSDFFTKVNRYSNDPLLEGSRYVIYGYEAWVKYDNIPTEYKNKFDLHLSSSFFIDYKSTHVLEFVRSFRERYKTEPGKMGFSGFDLGMFFLTGLKNHGGRFINHTETVEYSPLQTNYDLIPIDSLGGYENKSVYLLRYEDFEIKRLK